MDTLKIIGKSIKHHRERKGLSRRQLAKLTGISVETVKKIEQGRENFTIGTILKICAVLGIGVQIEQKQEASV